MHGISDIGNGEAGCFQMRLFAKRLLFLPKLRSASDPIDSSNFGGVWLKNLNDCSVAIVQDGGP
jgi:hypothetical protein